MEFVSAAANGLDDYSSYLTADQLREVYSQIEGNFVGLGVELKAAEGALLIVHVIPGSPAERAGIKAQDRIVAVDGKSTAEMSTDEAASMLTGAEGTWVRVTFTLTCCLFPSLPTFGLGAPGWSTVTTASIGRSQSSSRGVRNHTPGLPVPV